MLGQPTGFGFVNQQQGEYKSWFAPLFPSSLLTLLDFSHCLPLPTPIAEVDPTHHTMFHYTPHHYAPAPQPEFDPYTFSSSSPYTTYDTRRSHLERLALAQRQQERREAEELLLRRRQHELAMEKEVERRRIAAYEAALQQQVYAELEEERQRRARQQAYVRQQQQREALEAEHARRVVAARQQELARRHQEQLRRQQVAEQQQQVDHAGDDSIEAHLQPFLQLLFESPSTPTSTTEPQQSQPAPESTPAAPATTNAESATLPAPAPVEEPLVEANSNTVSAAEKLQHHYRTHLHRRQALSTLSSLGDSLSAQQATFALPSTLVFQPSPPSSTVSTDDSTPTVTPTPKLAFQSSNASFLAYEDFHVNLLSKIDAVSSGGDRTVKQARKALVKTVDAELSRLDRAREQAWAEQQQRAEVAPTTATEEQEADGECMCID